MSSPPFEPSQSPNYSFVPPPNPSPNMQALLLYLDAVNAWDLDRMLDAFDEALEHRILPKSLGRPVLNKNQYSTYLKSLHGMLRIQKIVVHEVIETENTITIHASTSGEGRSGAPYTNEVVQIMHFTPSHEEGDLPKMKLVKEFVDSCTVKEFFKQERAALAQAAKSQ